MEIYTKKNADKKVILKISFILGNEVEENEKKKRSKWRPNAITDKLSNEEKLFLILPRKQSSLWCALKPADGVGGAPHMKCKLMERRTTDVNLDNDFVFKLTPD